MQRIWNDTLEFPSVTVCNLNRVSKAKHQEMRQELQFIQSFNNASEGIVELWKEKEETPLMFQPFVTTTNGLLPSIDDLIIWCMFLKKPFLCKEHMVPVVTDGGLCASFTAKPQSGQGDTFTVHQLGEFCNYISQNIYTKLRLLRIQEIM